PVARLQQDAQGGWVLDSQFLPPLLTLQSSPWLVTALELLVTQLRARLVRLMAMRRESNQRMADFAVADVSLFWLLNALNSAEPVLADFLRHPQSPPERLYPELARLAGSLLTFSLEHQVNAIPAYRHDNLNDVFPPLFSLLGTLLEASLPSRMVAIEMTHDRRLRQWQARLNDPRLRSEVDFYLSVRSSLPVAQLQELFPRQCKVGHPDNVMALVNSSQLGIPLKPLGQVPAAIPLRMGNQYFTLDLSHPAALAMLESGSCMFYVPGTLGDPELELFAVLRS
ncbi:type VI secretion system baseplate subunit TssK, partial [Pantoea endophytica]